MLVIGGGVTGTGVALDAASRGLKTVLLEAHDLAFGTSRWSSKLVHGGLRYLAKGDVKLAHESAVERGILMTRTAPHLTRTLPMLFPLHDNAGHFVMSGLKAGNALRIAAGTSAHVLPRPRRVSRHEALALVPGLDPENLTGGLLSYDGQLVDDARLVVALARTAAGHGARIITRAKVTTLQGDGAEATDTLTGTTITIRAKAVINATGVWAGTLRPGAPAAVPRLTPRGGREVHRPDRNRGDDPRARRTQPLRAPAPPAERPRLPRPHRRAGRRDPGRADGPRVRCGLPAPHRFCFPATKSHAR